MVTILLGRGYDGEVKTLLVGNRPTVHAKFEELVNAGVENSDFNEISLHELNLSDGQRRMTFRKPMTEDEKKRFQEQTESTRKANLLAEARDIQRNNAAVNKNIVAEKARLKPLTAEHKAALNESEGAKTIPEPSKQ